jgi:DNA helicase-2/ATP-dependent DNA helicase PcrA
VPPTFNVYQKAVISFRKGYAVAMAAPGSGKTTVVVARIQQLLAEGTAPEEILSLTFTKEGAAEMMKRAGLKDIKHKLFTTFHSWALAFIKAEARALPFKVHHDYHGNPAPLCLPLDSARTLAQICRRLPEVEWKDAASYISTMKRRGLTPNAAAMQSQNDREDLYVLAYRKYDDALRSKGLLDFDSIVIETATLLEKRADVRARWQYKFVQVDEAQDTDAVQWRIVKAISEKYGNALAVGDENQGMYSWRGSESNLTSYFCSVFPNAAVMPLPINYRSTNSIVQYCKEIAPIQNDTVTNLSTPNGEGVAPEFYLYVREDEEAKGVINSCTDVGNTAILARTNRQLAAFEDECSQRNIRYKLLGKSGFWTQSEVKDTVAIIGSVAMPSDANILRMLTARFDATKNLRKNDTGGSYSTITLLKEFQQHNPDASTGKPMLLHELLTRFTCGDSSQDDIIHSIGHTIQTLRHDAQTMSGKEAAQRVIERFGLLSFYDVATEDEEDSKNFDNDPRDNILKLLEYSGRYPNLAQFYDYTQRARRATLARTNCLTLSTIHQSKGKEWDNVFVIGVNDGVLPHQKGDESEEKRIYFVACSRAAKRLVVSANGIPSELIRERLPKDEDKACIPVAAADLWNGFQLQG